VGRELWGEGRCRRKAGARWWATEVREFVKRRSHKVLERPITSDFVDASRDFRLCNRRCGNVESPSRSTSRWVGRMRGAANRLHLRERVSLCPESGGRSPPQKGYQNRCCQNNGIRHRCFGRVTQSRKLTSLLGSDLSEQPLNPESMNQSANKSRGLRL